MVGRFLGFFRSFLRRVLISSLGESAAEALLHILRGRLGRDPCELFWKNPKAFYSGVEEALGMGARILINLLVAAINWEAALNINSERFINLMRSGDPKSVEEIHSILRRLLESHREASG